VGSPAVGGKSTRRTVAQSDQRVPRLSVGGDGGEAQGGGCAEILHGPSSLLWCLVGPLLRTAHMGPAFGKPVQVYVMRSA